MVTSENAGFPSDVAQEALQELYHEALKEMTDAILAKVALGREPPQAKHAEVSADENGLPTLRDAPIFDGNGPRKYSALLEPSYHDEAARKAGKYPEALFPAFHRLLAFINAYPGTTDAFRGQDHPIFLQVGVQLQLEGAADNHLLRFGPVASTLRTRTAALRFIFAGLFRPRLDLALAAPIAMVRFDFDRMPIGPTAYIVRMSEGMQSKRWEAKAYGAKGHDSVLGAATHAIIFNGWGCQNGNHWDVVRSLGSASPEAHAAVDRFFAALRLATGVETGYAQLLWISRRWRMRPSLARPSLYAVAARRYPEAFDDFGWIREDIPQVSRDQLEAVSRILVQISAISDERFELALRRFNRAAIRHDPADAILDATIGLEILLGDAEHQSISWKLRMRAGALAASDGGPAAKTMIKAVSDVYDVRSAIVHGSARKRANKIAATPEEGRKLAINTLGNVLRHVIASPRFLDPARIDRELLLRIDRS